MTNLTAYLWGVAFTLIVETVVMMFVTDWLRKKVRREKETA